MTRGVENTSKACHFYLKYTSVYRFSMGIYAYISETKAKSWLFSSAHTVGYSTCDVSIVYIAYLKPFPKKYSVLNILSLLHSYTNFIL